MGSEFDKTFPLLNVQSFSWDSTHSISETFHVQHVKDMADVGWLLAQSRTL